MGAEKFEQLRGLVAQHGQSERLLSVRSGVRIPPGPLLLADLKGIWHVIEPRKVCVCILREPLEVLLFS